MDFSVIKRQVTVHLSGLLDTFNSYFHELTEEQAASYQWIANPFTESTEEQLPANSPPILLKELIDLSSDGTMRAHFNEVQLETFWSQCGAEFHVCHEAVMKVLIPFSTTYPCDAGFSAMTGLKTKCRARLTIEDDMCVCLSKLSPFIVCIIGRHQQQSSH